jgi:RNA polymerase sigma factor (sigma-70 family)
MAAIEFSHQIISFQNGLKRYAFSLVSDRDDASDLLQETYLKAFSYKEKLADYSNLKVWITTIMRNIFINHYRRRKKSREILNDEIAVMKDLEQGFEFTESYYTENELNKAMVQLTDELKQPFAKYVDGFKYREIADEMGINIGTVKSRIFTARKQLMETLQDFNPNN